MIKFSSTTSLDILFFASISLVLFSGINGNSSKNGTNSQTHVNSRSHTGSKVVVLLIAILAIGSFSFFLFKLWQKKKREEQYARLLKLFEEDDELEVELGLRD